MAIAAILPILVHVALIGSAGLLELAEVNGHAARSLGIGTGDCLTVDW